MDAAFARDSRAVVLWTHDTAVGRPPGTDGSIIVPFQTLKASLSVAGNRDLNTPHITRESVAELDCDGFSCDEKSEDCDV